LEARLRGAVVVIAGAVVVAAGLAGCGSSGGAETPARAGSTGSGEASPVPASAAASSAPPTVYRAVDDLCATADLTSLTQLFPTQSQTRHTTTATAVMTEMRCSAALASTSTRGYLQIEVNVSKDPRSARFMYEGLRGAETKTAPGGKVTDVSGVGSAAYTFVDEGLGPRLAVTDGNLYMTIVWSSHGEQADSVPRDIVTRLGAVCTATMAKLR
jgi:hypothetical protein